jgi:hypothetical protein
MGWKVFNIYIYIYPYENFIGGQNSIHLEEKIESYSLSGFIFYDVLVFQIDGDGSWDSYPAKYYWAKNIGLIKREKLDTDKTTLLEGWELIDYEVTQ